MLLLFSSFNFSQEKPKAGQTGYQPEIRTYFLKHITPQDVKNSLRPYFFELSADRTGNMFTVMIAKDKIPEFERLLKKIDVEKKKIIFRIFTVIASNEGNGAEIRNKDLKNVLTELKSVLSFKSYKLDGASLLTVKEGSEDNNITLLTKIPGLKLLLYGVKIKGDTVGKRTVEIMALKLRAYEKTLIGTETSIKENGYLVAGVSRAGKNGDALVLVINAEIK